MSAGYLMDFATDNFITSLAVDQGRLTVSAEGSSYKTLIIPGCELIPLSTLKQVIQLAENGATVIFEKVPQDVPGFYDLDQRRKEFHDLIASLKSDIINENIWVTKVGKGTIIINDDVKAALISSNIRGEKLVESGLKFIRRAFDGDIYYYLVNHSAHAIHQNIQLQVQVGSAILMNPDNGDFGKTAILTEDGQSSIQIQLESGQSVIIRCTNKDATQIPDWKYLGETLDTIPLTGSWNVQFVNGGPDLPRAVTMDTLTSWTELSDEKAVNFSGQALYEYNYTISEDWEGEYTLALGKVAESARVWVNDQEVGVLWSIPYEARIGKYLKEGNNSIRIEVANLMANRIRYMDKEGITWRKFHEINFVNIDYNPFDASGWQPITSGLIGPVVMKKIDLE
jgi:hypothetical protein